MAEKNIFEKIKQSNHLPQLPQVMLKLIKACGSENANIDDLTDIISTDPSLTSKLLQIIGSPYVNLPKEVKSIKSAVVYLGLETIKNIAISSSAMHFFSLPKDLPEFDISGFWYHSYKCGLISRKIARQNDLPNPDEFFLGGLLHDIGRLVLIQTFPEEYRTLLETAVTEEEMINAEMELFGVDTPQVSAWIFSHWNLDPMISDAMLFINESVDKIEAEPFHVKIIYMANVLSGSDPLDKISMLSPLTPIPETRMEIIAAEAEDEAVQMAKNLGIKIYALQDKNSSLDKGATLDQEAEQAIALEMKNFSLFYGTLQNLFSDKDLPAVMETVQKGLKIIFNVPRVFFFLLDEKKNMLAGACSREDKNHTIVRRIGIPLSNEESIIVKSVQSNDVQTSFKRAGSTRLAVSDTRIILLLETKGFFCIPISARGKGLGVMILGVDEELAHRLGQNKDLLGLFSKQTGVCIQNIQFHQKYALDVNEKKMEAYATLTDKVIHEINNPIAIIKNYLETLRMKLPDKHPAQEELSVVGEEITRVSLLVDGLSSFSRPKISGFESIDINKLCSGILEILKKSMLMPRQIRANISMDPEIPKIKTDGNSLKQVLINLIKNSAEAMETGGKIDIQTRFLPGSAKILIDEKKKLPGTIEIRIKDDGPGIKPEIMEKLFEPYNSSKKTGKNSGLGLAVVHSIVRELNGRITCDSKNGRGTCFVVSLPTISTRVSSKSQGK